jgi:hypothetical protein
MKSYLSVILILPLLSACAHFADAPPVVPEPTAEEKAEVIKQSLFTSVGYASIDAQPGNSFDLKMLNAIKASKIEAYKEMVEQIHGVLISADDTVQGAVLIDDKIEAQVKGLVRGARILKSYHEGGVYITELEFDMQTLLFLQKTEASQQAGKAIRVKPSVYY